MMKRLLIVVMVVFMASAANAAIVQLGMDGVTDGAGNITNLTSLSEITVVSDTDDFSYDYRLRVSDTTPGDIGDVVIYQPAGDSGHAGDDADIFEWRPLGPFAHVWKVLAADTGSPFNIAAGTHFSAPVTYTGPGELLIELCTSGYQVLDSVIVTPEPATMLLLGLGGLFLRRRK